MFNKSKTVVLAGFLALTTGAANATPVTDTESPLNWRLADYVGGPVAVFYTGSTASSCSQGVMQMPSTATADEINRFWSLILTAKTTGAKVGVIYDSVTCLISTFWLTP